MTDPIGLLAQVILATWLTCSALKRGRLANVANRVHPNGGLLVSLTIVALLVGGILSIMLNNPGVSTPLRYTYIFVLVVLTVDALILLRAWVVARNTRKPQLKE